MRTLISALVAISVATACDSPVAVSVVNRGDVMRSPRVQFVFWGSYWLSANGSSAADLIVRSYGRVSPVYFSGLTQYGAGMPELAGMMTTTAYEPPAFATIGDAAMLLQSLVTSRVLSVPVDRAISPYFVVVLPPGTSAPYRAYHDGVVFFDGSTAQAAFVTSSDFTVSDMLHELVEGITDPRGNGVRVPALTPPKGEIADACENACSVYHVAGVRVPAYWSQSDGACVAPGATPLRVRNN